MDEKLQGILDEMNRYFDVNDIDGVKAFLEGQVTMLHEEGDWQHELTILNELVGVYRKTDAPKQGLYTEERLLKLLNEQKLELHEAGATSYLNLATACRVYKRTAEAEAYFKKALDIYEAVLDPEDFRFASFYNNYALLLIDSRKYEEAESYLLRAMGLVKKLGAVGQIVTTHTTLAQLYRLMDKATPEPEKRMNAELDKAFAILSNWEKPKDNGFAFICKCSARVFEILGRTKDGEKLTGMAQEFYDGNRAGGKRMVDGV